MLVCFQDISPVQTKHPKTLQAKEQLNSQWGSQQWTPAVASWCDLTATDRHVVAMLGAIHGNLAVHVTTVLADAACNTAVISTTGWGCNLCRCCHVVAMQRQTCTGRECQAYPLQCCMTSMSLSGALHVASSLRMLGWSGKCDIISISLVYCSTHESQAAHLHHFCCRCVPFIVMRSEPRWCRWC